MKPRSVYGFTIALGIFGAACAGPVSPTKSAAVQSNPTAPAPSPPAPPPPSMLSLEAENGTGDGEIRLRSQASGGRTVHLGPGERRSWTFTSDSSPAEYAIAIRYSNGRYGPNEVITLVVDGRQTAAFQDRNTGEDTPEGWNVFVTDDGGTSVVQAGTHTVTLQVTGGDGCVEIDVATLKISI
jgi:hypothetical protein